MTRFALFAQPVWLTLLLLVPLLAYAAWRASRRRAAVALPLTHRLDAIAPTLRTRLRWLPAACVLAALGLTVVAVARPQEGRHQTLIDSEGIAIELVVDTSGSMRAMDFTVDGRPTDRLTAVKRVAGNFLRGDGDRLPGRPTDLVGLITFATYADAVSPLTLDHAFVIDALENAEIAADGESETAIGDALGLALERLQALDRSDTGDTAAASRVVILLTDGENTAGTLTPEQAADLARSLGVRVYTIGAGTTGSAPVPVTDPFFGRTVMRQMQVRIDEDTLRDVAERTGGAYFRATDTESLAAVYAKIDELEKVKLEERTVTDVNELAVDRWGGLPPLLGVAIAVLGVGTLLENLWLRRSG